MRRVLEIAALHDGQRSAAEEAIRAEYYAGAAPKRKSAAERLKQQRTRAGNVLIGMSTYGLYEDDQLTAIGRELLATTTEKQLYERFARHILHTCHGLTVLQAVRNLQKRGIEPTKGTLSAELDELGIHLPRATTHHLILLAWLRQAGAISTTGYTIDGARTAEINGVALPTVDEWDALTNAQRAVLRILKRLSSVHGKDPISAQVVIETAEHEFGRIFGTARDQLRRRVFGPLEAGGWVTMSKPSEGRGGKSGTIMATDKLLNLDPETLPAAVSGDIPADLRAKLTTPTGQIYADLDSKDTHTKGIALELLALRISSDLGITPRRFRLRGIKTAGAEVDLISEAAHLHFSRWQFQCKNSARVTVGDLAKEVGLCVLLKSHVIVMVTTGQIGNGVRRHAKSLAESTGYQVVLIDRALLQEYGRQGAQALFKFFHEQAVTTMQLKRGQVDIETEDEAE